jgi:hypothetical protein
VIPLSVPSRPPAPPINRKAIVTVHNDIFRMLLRGRSDIAVTSDWPEDAVILDILREGGQLRLLVCSATFDEVDDGYLAPDWSPTFTSHHLVPETATLVRLLNAFSEQEELDAAARPS